MNSDQIKRIVVRAPNWVGDAVMALPALHELRRRFADAHITVVSPPGTSDVFIESNLVNETLIHARGSLTAFRETKVWRTRNFDVAVIFPNSFGSALTAFLARVPMRIGYATDRRSFLLTDPLAVPEWKDVRHESFYYLNIVAELAGMVFRTSTNEVDPQFDLTISAERKEKARRKLSDEGARPNRPLALLCPGSVNSRAKRWPAERYAALADQLAHAGMTVALIGSPAELEVSQEVASLSHSSPIVMTGKTSVAEVVSMISIADVLVTNDTGPAHIGAALGTRTIAIFGPTNPLTTYPLSEHAQTIRHPPDCAPCMLRDCPIDHRCMTAISPEEVFRRALPPREVQSIG